jgi:dUTP pyrophosphatase
MKVKIVKIKRLSDNAVVPSYAHGTDAGLDLVATSMSIIEDSEFGYYEYGTGLAVSIPDGYVGLIFPRSSISNTGMLLSNSVGVIDSGYLGEIKFRFRYIKGTRHYNVGEKVGQLIIMPYPKIEFEEVEDLGESERGSGGFGSTDKK